MLLAFTYYNLHVLASAAIVLLRVMPRVYTVFIQIVAAATINFSLAWVRLLIKGSSYSRVAFINFGPILDSVKSIKIVA